VPTSLVVILAAALVALAIEPRTVGRACCAPSAIIRRHGAGGWSPLRHAALRYVIAGASRCGRPVLNAGQYARDINAGGPIASATKAAARMTTSDVGTPGIDQPNRLVSHSGLLPPGVGCIVIANAGHTNEAPSVTTIAGIFRAWITAPMTA